MIKNQLEYSKSSIIGTDGASLDDYLQKSFGVSEVAVVRVTMDAAEQVIGERYHSVANRLISVLGMPEAHAAQLNVPVRTVEKALEVPIQTYLGDVDLSDGPSVFVFDLSELKPRYVEQLSRQLTDESFFVVTDSVLDLSVQSALTRRRHLKFLGKRFRTDHIQQAAESLRDALDELPLGEGQVGTVVAAGSEKVNFLDQLPDLNMEVNGVTLRFQQKEIRNAGIKVDIKAYAIPLIRALAAAKTKEQVQRILNKFDLQIVDGEVAVGVQFLNKLAALYEAQAEALVSA